MKIGSVFTEMSAKKQRISNSAWCSPSAVETIPASFFALSSCNTDGEECVSVTLPLGWGEGARFQKEKNIFPHVHLKIQLF